MTARRTVPAVVTLLTGLAALVWIGSATFAPAPSVPQFGSDGAVSAVRMLDGEVVQAGHAVLPAGLLGGPLGMRVLQDEELSASELALRVTFAPGAVSDSVVLVARDGVLELRAVAIDDVGRVFDGGLPLRDGSVTGTAARGGTDDADYRAQTSITEADGCLSAEIALELEGAEESIALTVCEGAGVTSLRLRTADGAEVGYDVTDAPVPFGDTTLDVAGRDWAAAAQWQPVASTPLQRDPFGELTGARGLRGAPAALATGGVAVVDGISDDVVVYDAATDGVAAPRWRAHPGGQLVGVSAVGDMVVAIRTGGGMVAYSVDGVRLWESDAATESVIGSVVGVTGRLTFATLDGGVWMVDAATGEVLWSHTVADQLTSGVSADDRVTFAFDTEGSIFGFAANGQQAFDGSVPSPFEVVTLDQAHSYLGRGATMEAYELQYSQFQWAVQLPGLVLEACSTGDRLIVTTSGGTVTLAPTTGAVDDLDERAADALECGQGAAAVVIGDTLELWPSAGSSATLQLPEPLVQPQYRATAPAAGGIWVVTSGALVWWGP